MTTRTFLLTVSVLSGLGLAAWRPPQAVPTTCGRVVHSFSPTPLFRGTSVAGSVHARAELYVNSRNYGAGAASAAFEVAIDYAALDATTGVVLADHCVARTFTMRTPLDLKKIQIEVVGTGVQTHFPDGTTDVATLYAAGSDVEVVILAMAVRGIGSNQSGIEKTTLRVHAGDYDGDGKGEFYFKDADWQLGRFTS
jgi:hypothetical protein